MVRLSRWENIRYQELIKFSHGTKENVDRAVKAARKAFQTTWGNNLHATERANCKSVFMAIKGADGSVVQIC
jgi:acyl-CoA reductase-like NAD-dependent aldehyde dehydrogenase